MSVSQKKRATAIARGEWDFSAQKDRIADRIERFPVRGKAARPLTRRQRRRSALAAARKGRAL